MFAGLNANNMYTKVKPAFIICLLMIFTSETVYFHFYFIRIPLYSDEKTIGCMFMDSDYTAKTFQNKYTSL